MEKQYSFEEFYQIIRCLRSENGCPWDRAQTHDSLRECMTEEAAELLASIRIFRESGSAENMCEELGDVLLQVMLHSVIAEEEGIFTLNDVIRKISEKMIRRHPHVFGSEKAGTDEQLNGRWEAIKKKEKEKQTWLRSPLRDIPPELSTLSWGSKVLKKTEKIYGKESITDIMEENSRKMAAGQSCFQELFCRNGLENEKSTYTEEKRQEVKEIIGELLVKICAAGEQYQLSPEEILREKIETLIETKEPVENIPENLRKPSK